MGNLFKVTILLLFALVLSAPAFSCVACVQEKGSSLQSMPPPGDLITFAQAAAPLNLNTERPDLMSVTAPTTHTKEVATAAKFEVLLSRTACFTSMQAQSHNRLNDYPNVYAFEVTQGCGRPDGDG